MGVVAAKEHGELENHLQHTRVEQSQRARGRKSGEDPRGSYKPVTIGRPMPRCLRRKARKWRPTSPDAWCDVKSWFSPKPIMGTLPQPFVNGKRE